jgi:hypothetical protein
MRLSLLAKEGTTWNFASNFAVSERARFFYMPQSWDMGQIILLPHGRKACPKNPTALVRSEHGKVKG